MPPTRVNREWAVAATLLCTFALWMAFTENGVRALADRVSREEAGHAVPPQLPGAAPRIADRGDDADEGEAAAVSVEDHATDAGATTTTTRAAAKGARLEDVCVDGTAASCTRWAMDGFYRAVADAEADPATHRVRVSYYGDSVTSTDAVPARVRSRLQRELGDGGPGWIWVAPPHRFVHHEGVSIANAGTWKTWTAPMGPVADGLHGVGGSTAETTSGTATLASKTGFTELEVFFLAQPGGGTAEIVVGGEVKATIDTAGEAKRAGYERVQLATASKKVQVRTAGKVRLFGVLLENAAGAVVDNMGLVSATVKNLAHNRADHWEHQLAHRGADLVIIMLGANEAQWLPTSKTAMAEYRGRYEAILAPIRAGLPQSTCLVVSPLDQAVETDGTLASRPVMPVMVAAQRAAAVAQGCAFFSAYDWAGGKGSALTWRKRGLVGDDFQHLARKGANKLADAIVDALLAGARDFQTTIQTR